MRVGLALCSLLCLSLLFACDTADPPSPQITPNVLAEEDAWTYTLRFTQSPVDSAVVDTTLDTTLRMRVAKTGVAIDDRRDLFEVEVFEKAKPEEIERTWYQQSPDSLVEVAYKSLSVPGFPLSKSNDSEPSGRGLVGLPYLVRQRLAQSDKHFATTTDTTIRADSRIVLQGPLEPGASWISFREPFLNTRTVTDRQSLDTPAGQFDTIEIENLAFVSPDTLRWFDYYSDEGLVRRTITDTLEQRNEDGEVIGEFVRREVYTLTDRRE